MSVKGIFAALRAWLRRLRRRPTCNKPAETVVLVRAITQCEEPGCERRFSNLTPGRRTCGGAYICGGCADATERCPDCGRPR